MSAVGNYCAESAFRTGQGWSTIGGGNPQAAPAGGIPWEWGRDTFEGRGRDPRAYIYICMYTVYTYVLISLAVFLRVPIPDFQSQSVPEPCRAEAFQRKSPPQWS